MGPKKYHVSLSCDIISPSPRLLKSDKPHFASRSTSNIPEAAGFFRTRPGLEAPDIEFHFAPSMFFDEGLSAPADHGYCFGPVVIAPTSRGRVMLRTPLPDSKPRVLCNFLTTEEDRPEHARGHADGVGDRRAVGAEGN